MLRKASPVALNLVSSWQHLPFGVLTPPWFWSYWLPNKFHDVGDLVMYRGKGVILTDVGWVMFPKKPTKEATMAEPRVEFLPTRLESLSYAAVTSQHTTAGVAITVTPVGANEAPYKLEVRDALDSDSIRATYYDTAMAAIASAVDVVKVQEKRLERQGRIDELRDAVSQWNTQRAS